MLTFQCPQAGVFGIWTPNKAGCPFVCIVPCYGIDDRYNFEGEITEQERIHHIAPNGLFIIQISYTNSLFIDKEDKEIILV